MAAGKYISASCIISSQIVYKNLEQEFIGAGANAAAFLLSVYQHYGFNYPKFYKMDNLSKLGWLAAEVLLGGHNKEAYQPEDTGMILANANASLDSDVRYLASVNDVPSPSLFVYTLPNIVIGEIAIRHNFKGEGVFYIQNQFDAAFMAEQVNYLLNNNILKACICGWVDFLGEEYKAALFLITLAQNDTSLVFTAENMNRIFNMTRDE